MKRGEIVTTVLMTALAAVFIATGGARLPLNDRPMFVHPAVVVYSDRMIAPLVVTAEKVLPAVPTVMPWRKVVTRAPSNKGLPVLAVLKVDPRSGAARSRERKPRPLPRSRSPCGPRT